MNSVSYALCQVCLASGELSQMVSLGERKGYLCISCASGEGAEAISQEEQEQALEAELAALEGLLDYLDTLPVNLGAASVATQEFREEAP